MKLELQPQGCLLKVEQNIYIILFQLCWSRKYPCPPQVRSTEIPRGKGVSKAQIFEQKYDTKMEFLEGWWGSGKTKPSMGGVWTFSGTTHY